jgi:hypothetical protein
MRSSNKRYGGISADIRKLEYIGTQSRGQGALNIKNIKHVEAHTRFEKHKRENSAIILML